MNNNGSSDASIHCVKVTWLEYLMVAVDRNDDEGYMKATTNSLDDAPPNSLITEKIENALHPHSLQPSHRELTHIDEATNTKPMTK